MDTPMQNNGNTKLIWWTIAVVLAIGLYFWMRSPATPPPAAPVDDTTNAIQDSLQSITVPNPDQGTQAVDQGIKSL